MKNSLSLFLLFSLLFSSLLLLPVKAQTGEGTFVFYVKLGHWQGTTFIEDETFPASEGVGKVEVWTQPASSYDSGRKVATGDVGKPISLSLGRYKVYSRVSLPNGYDRGSYKELNCPDFNITTSGQTVTCTFQAYKKSDPRNYGEIMPSSERPSGAPPFIEEDSSLGSYQFVKNVLDLSDEGAKLDQAAFFELYGKRVMVVQKQVGGGITDLNKIISPKVYISFYDISNPFSPTLIKENEIKDEQAYYKTRVGREIGGLGPFIVIDNHPFIYWRMFYEGSGYFAKINSDWTISELKKEEAEVEDESLVRKTSQVVLNSLFRGPDGNIYGVVPIVDNRFGSYENPKFLAFVRFNSSNSSFSQVSKLEIDQSYYKADNLYNFWSRSLTPIKIGNKFYLLISSHKVVSRIHTQEMAGIAVIDFTNPSSPKLLSVNLLSGLNDQKHFPDASEVEKIRIYADFGKTELDRATGYLYDIFNHTYDYENGEWMLSTYRKSGGATGGGIRTADIYSNLRGPWRYRNGVIIRKLSGSGNFNYLSRLTLCETEGGIPAGEMGTGFYLTIICGEGDAFSGQNKPEKAFYGVGEGPVTSLSSFNSHAFNGVLLLKDLNKGTVVPGGTYGSRNSDDLRNGPVVAAVVVDNKLKIIPDNSGEFLKFRDSLKKIISWPGNSLASFNLNDAYLQQVDDKTFAIFQIHPTSIDVVKLTLTQPRPLPSSSPSFTPQATTMTLTTASATPSTGTSSPIQGTLYSIKSILLNLRRILDQSQR